MNASVIQLGTGKHLPHCGCSDCAARTEHIILASAAAHAPTRASASVITTHHGDAIPAWRGSSFYRHLRTRIARLRARGFHVDDQDRDALIFLAGTLWGAAVAVGTIAALFTATAGAH